MDDHRTTRELQVARARLDVLDKVLARLAETRAQRDKEHADRMREIDERIAVINKAIDDIDDPVKRLESLSHCMDADAEAWLLEMCASHIVATRLLTDAEILADTSYTFWDDSRADGIVVGTLLDGTRVIVLIEAKHDIDAQKAKALMQLRSAHRAWTYLCDFVDRGEVEDDPVMQEEVRAHAQALRVRELKSLPVMYAFAGCEFTETGETWIRKNLKRVPWIRIDMDPHESMTANLVVDRRDRDV